MGDIIMIKNMSMSTNVSVFSDNKIHYSITGALGDDPVARNCFKVIPYLGELTDKDLGAPLRYNQVFSLQSIANPDFYLASDSLKKLNSISNIPYGKNEVFMTQLQSRLTGWSCIAWDPENRLETELEPIEQNMPLVLNHHSTGQALCVEDSIRKWSPFGREFEICCSTRLTTHKAHSQSNCFSLSVKIKPTE